MMTCPTDDPSQYLHHLQEIAAKEDCAKLSTVALKFTNVLNRMPKVAAEMTGFLAPNQTLDYDNLLRRLEPALEDATIFLNDLDNLPPEFKNHPVVVRFTQTVLANTDFAAVNDLMQRLNTAKEEVQHLQEAEREAVALRLQQAEEEKAQQLQTIQTRKAFDALSWSGSLGGDRFGHYRDVLLKNVTQRFRWIPEGSFLMGSPEEEAAHKTDETQHLVSFKTGFWIADTTCTQALWTAIMADNPARFNDNAENPVEQVSWNDIQLFLKRANEFMHNSILRLPSEAQWEYTCREGRNTTFSFNNSITTAEANYDGNYAYNGGLKGESRDKTVEVKFFPPNKYGVYQMHGNVSEWCQDTYDSYAHTPVDGTAHTGGDNNRRIVRGGAWLDHPSSLRCAYRSKYSPDRRLHDVGFRLMCTTLLV